MNTNYRGAAALMAVALIAAAVPTVGTGRAEAAPSAYTNIMTVAGWGSYNEHQSQVPKALVGRPVAAVSAGEEHSLVLTTDGAVAGWGRNDHGQVSPPTTLQSGLIKADVIDAGDFDGVAVLSDGSVMAWGATGDVDEGQAEVPVDMRGPAPTTPVTDVSAGTYHSLALTRAGTVRAWGALNRHGSVDHGQTQVPEQLRDGSRRVVDVAAGKAHSLAVDSAGKVWAWGSNQQGATDLPSALENAVVTAVAAHGASSLALLADGRIVGWGDSGRGTTLVPQRLTGVPVATIDLGAEVAVARTRTGQIVTWGDSATDMPDSLAAHAPFTGAAAGGRHVLVMHRAPKTATRLTLAAPRKVAMGKPVTVKIRLRGATSGKAVLRDRGRKIAVLKLVRSSATTARGSVVLRRLPVGTHRLSAVYAGSTLTLSAKTPARTVVVRRR